MGKKSIGIIIALGFLLGILPFLITWAATPKNAVFSGTLANPDDYSAYLAAIQQGRSGSWLYHYNFTPENIQPRFMYPIYILIGKLANFFGGSNIFWLHFSRLVFSFFAFYALLFWVRSVFKAPSSLQSTAWILILFGSGLGFLSLLLKSTSISADLSYPEWNTISSLITSPHYILSTGLLAIYYGALLRFEKRCNTWKWAMITTLSGIGIGFTYPYHVLTISLFTGIWLIAIFIKQKTVSMSALGQGVIIITPIFIFLLYYIFIARQDTYWELNFVQNNNIAAPTFKSLVIGLGLLGFFALFSIILKANKLTKGNLLYPFIWICVNLLVLYSPIPFAGRFLLGFHIPVATLAAFFIENTLLKTINKPNFWRRMIILITLPSTVLVIIFSVKNALITKDYPFYYPKDELTAANWLAKQLTEEDITLANYPVGGYLPTVANTKVFLGQMHTTVDLEDKLASWKQFWNPQTPQSWRNDFVEKWNITYIYHGYFERIYSKDYIQLPWKIIYEDNGVTIYSLENN